MLPKIIDNTFLFCNKTTNCSVLASFPDRKETFCICLIISSLKSPAVLSQLLPAQMLLRLRSNREANGV